jgi:PASTA domain
LVVNAGVLAAVTLPPSPSPSPSPSKPSLSKTIRGMLVPDAEKLLLAKNPNVKVKVKVKAWGQAPAGTDPRTGVVYDSEPSLGSTVPDDISLYTVGRIPNVKNLTRAEAARTLTAHGMVAVWQPQDAPGTWSVTTQSPGPASPVAWATEVTATLVAPVVTATTATTRPPSRTPTLASPRPATGSVGPAGSPAVAEPPPIGRTAESVAVLSGAVLLLLLLALYAAATAHRGRRWVRARLAVQTSGDLAGDTTVRQMEGPGDPSVHIRPVADAGRYTIKEVP